MAVLLFGPTRILNPVEGTATSNFNYSRDIVQPDVVPTVVEISSGCGHEVPLEVYGLAQREEAMPAAVLARIVRGVSCRDYEGVIDGGFGVAQRISAS